MEQLLVSIVAPVYNEASVIEEFVLRIIKVIQKEPYLFEIILIDDGSTDGSLDILMDLTQQEACLRVIELRKNYGQTPALQAGIDQAKGDIIITMDSDLQHFPEEIPNFLRELEKGEADVVCGWRYDRQEGLLRKIPSRIANAIIRKISGFRIHDYGTTFRAYRAEIIKDLRLFGQQHRFIPVLAHLAGGRISEIKIKNRERPQGESNYGISRTFAVLFDIFYLYFDVNYMHHPFRFFGKLFLFFFTIASVILFGLLTYSYIFNIPGVREHSGWFLSSLFLYLTSFQILMTGLIAEIIIRIYYFSQKKTYYHIRSEWKGKGPKA